MRLTLTLCHTLLCGVCGQDRNGVDHTGIALWGAILRDERGRFRLCPACDHTLAWHWPQWNPVVQARCRDWLRGLAPASVCE